MPTGFVYDARFLDHDTGPTHPETPQRLNAIVERLKAKQLWDRLTHLPFQPADDRWIRAVHDDDLVDKIDQLCKARKRFIDSPDTPICPASASVARLASGGVLAAVDAVMAGEVDNAFCAVRPPGHHAEPNRTMGFCLFNHIAIAANYLIEHHGLQRVAIIDFDVHHGNGTQAIFYDRADVFFASIHEHPSYLFPGTGFMHETGQGPGEGTTLNLPMPPQCGDDDYRHALVFKLMPKLEAFDPQFLLISAGFDASREDPLAHMNVSPEGFGWMTRHLLAEAKRLCHGRVVSQLEGGYYQRSLAECVRIHVEAFLSDGETADMMAMKMGF